MFRTLTLTSPKLMKGPDVVRAQQLLARSTFGHFSPGSPDGEYGVHTAAATRRAQFWLGRPKGALDGVYRLELAQQLAGEKKLTVAQRTRRRWRLKHKPVTPIGVRLITELTRYIGTKESPADSNNVLFTREYMGSDGHEWSARRPGPPWCAIFIWHGLRALKWPLDHSVNWAYCPSILAAARDCRAGLSVLPHPEKGALVIYDWDHDGIGDHIGVVTGVHGGSTFTTIEGNTSPTDNSNGGEVMRRTRDLADVAGFVRIHHRKG